jgi:hypothetical protein
MTKIDNNPMNYKKRTDLVKSKSSCKETHVPNPLSVEKQALLVAAFGKAGNQKAGYIAFSSIVGR